jgi:hypothetical protein
MAVAAPKRTISPFVRIAVAIGATLGVAIISALTAFFLFRTR